MRIQQHMLRGLLELGPLVSPILFTNEDYYLDYCKKEPRVTCIADYKSNPFRLPYIRSFFSKLENLPYSCDFYGYVNGDVLLSPQLVEVLRDTLRNIESGLLHQHVLIVGRRTNYPWANVTHLHSGPAFASQLDALCSTDAPYMSNAIVGIFAIPKFRTILYSLLELSTQSR